MFRNVRLVFGTILENLWKSSENRQNRSLVRYCSCHSNIKFICSRHRVISSIYNIASRATQSNSVYVSVLQISTVLADGVRISLCQKFFSHEQPLSARGKILYLATLMDTETRPNGLKTNTIFQPFLMG